MLNRYKEERSAQRVVPYLSHGTFASLRIWLRGLATNIICSFGGRLLESSAAVAPWQHVSPPLTRPISVALRGSSPAAGN
jgi:hypothetical protein